MFLPTDPYVPAQKPVCPCPGARINLPRGTYRALETCPETRIGRRFLPRNPYRRRVGEGEIRGKNGRAMPGKGGKTLDSMRLRRFLPRSTYRRERPGKSRPSSEQNQVLKRYYIRAYGDSCPEARIQPTPVDCPDGQWYISSDNPPTRFVGWVAGPPLTGRP